MVCLCVSTPYVLLMYYLTIRFTYFLDWLMLSLFRRPKPSVLPCGSALTDIYKVPPRTQSVTTIDAHCSKRADLYPPAPIKTYASYPRSAYCNSGTMPSVTGGVHSSQSSFSYFSFQNKKRVTCKWKCMLFLEEKRADDQS